jgi:hypothetical protein
VRKEKPPSPLERSVHQGHSEYDFKNLIYPTLLPCCQVKKIPGTVLISTRGKGWWPGPCDRRPSLDHLICPVEEGSGDRQPEGLGRLERECLAIVVARRLTADDVLATLPRSKTTGDRNPV